MRQNRIKPNFYKTQEQLVNHEVKRSLKEGKLISQREVGLVSAIKKGDVVTSIYKHGSMQITAKSVALQDGALGKTIELENQKSKKRFYGVVVDSTTVEITN